MGYTTSFNGELTITPPLTFTELEAIPFREDRAKDKRLDVKVRVDEETVTTPDGVLTRRTGVALLTTWEDEMRGYDIVENVQLFLDTHPGHTLTGRMDAEGEQAADLWRLEIQHGRAVKVTPRIVWPDGSETEVPR